LSLDALVDGLQEEGQNEKFLKDNSMESAPAHSLEKKELIEMLENSVQNLKENEQLVVSLYYRKDLSMKEIASVMCISEPRVSQLHASALRKLRLTLGNYYTA
jgi:RNA polymerase sigma factor for flagellar operon FliA